MTIVTAGPEHATVLAALINRAYEVERFFVEGDRTNPAGVREAMGRGQFLMAATEAGEIAGTIFVEVAGGIASFGMLAVSPEHQQRGIGRRLISQAEQHAREAGASTMEILVVNLRTDLLPRYRRAGYVPAGEAPYVHRPVTRPCHFIRMAKTL
jgi:GNAT superfamily N-acetyltransferase